jgi:exonuclease SbcC
MIIDDLWAENVLKYAKLELNDIPTSGLVGISGDNESGKSSIGETMCFALFGRTFSLAPSDLPKLIRWGETRCMVGLVFTAADGRRYRVVRYLDADGSHGARLTEAGGEEPLARGSSAVQQALEQIIGFGYSEFVESFYLAQREITTPHPHSDAVKAMAGVAAMEAVAASCEREVQQAEQVMGETRQQREEVKAQIAALGLQPGHLDFLESSLDTARSSERHKRGEVQDIRDFTGRFDETSTALQESVDQWLALGVTSSFSRSG